MTYLPSGYLHDPDTDGAHWDLFQSSNGISSTGQNPTNQARAWRDQSGNVVYGSFYRSAGLASQLAQAGVYLLTDPVSGLPAYPPQLATDDLLFSGAMAVGTNGVGGAYSFPLRMPAAGIAAFQAARASGSSISDALAAGKSASAGYYTQGQTPATIDALIAAHQENEQAARTALAEPTLLNQIGQLTGVRASPRDIAYAAGLSRAEANTYPMSSVVSGGGIAKLFAAKTPPKAAPRPAPAPAVVRSAPVATAAPHPLAVLGAGALFGVAGYFFAPSEVRLPVAGGAALAGVLLARFVR